MSFIHFKIAIQDQFKYMTDNCEYLFVVDLDKDELWNLYLDSFPPGTNEIFRERREYDCQCCKQFIRTMGAVVGIIDGKLVSIWDCNPPGYYKYVAKALKGYVESKTIKEPFLHYETHVGTDLNHQYLEDGGSLVWEHFYLRLPTRFVVSGSSISTSLGQFRTAKSVFGRGMNEISLEAAEMVVELIEQNSLYRGEEHLKAVQDFIKTKKTLIKDYEMEDHDLFFWEQSVKQGPGIKNTVIGTLLIDLSEGKDLEYAVNSFETKVAPENYKRPTALITKGMIKKAEEKVQELGLEDSLPRRYAVAEDITINNVLFASRSAKKVMNVFEELSDQVGSKKPNFDKVEEVSIDTFISDILPKSKEIELFVDNSHENKLMSVIAPIYDDAPLMFKWPNQFSWSYNGDLADTIKERVKKAGGAIEGVLRCSLSWYNTDDLDIHVVEPSGNLISYNNKKNPRTQGFLDVDMNVSSVRRDAVENISWPDLRKMEEGTYEVIVHNYTKREAIDVGFEVEVEHDGQTYHFAYDKAVKGNEKVKVVRFNFSKTDGIKIIKSIPSSQSSKEFWGITTQQFYPVSMVMNSPNHWDGNEVGNKHYFFILDKCKNDSKARGFYNEFLRNDLTEHRKVFEVLGSKMKAEESDKQLSGLGFSSTQRNHVYLKVSGSFSRTIKVLF